MPSDNLVLYPLRRVTRRITLQYCNVLYCTPYTYLVNVNRDLVCDETNVFAYLTLVL